RREPSGLKVAHCAAQRSGLSSRARVRPVSVSTRRRILLASCATSSRPSGEKQEPVPPIFWFASRQVPPSQSRHGEVTVINHFPSGLKPTPLLGSMGSSATLVPSRVRQTSTP